MAQTEAHFFTGSFAHLGKLASFILNNNFNSFVRDHFDRCSAFDVLSHCRLLPYIDEHKDKVFHHSCEYYLRTLTTYGDESLIQEPISNAFRDELLAIEANEITIDDFVMINCIRAESLKKWIGEYTDDVSVALAIVREIDSFTSAYNRTVLQKYSKLLTSTLEVRNNTLKESNEKLKEFAAVASHDLKAPLRKISTYVELIIQNLSQGNASKVSAYLAKTKSTTNKMSKLIDDLLFFSTLDGKHHNTAKCDLQCVIEDVLDNLEPAIRETNARIIIPDKLPCINAVYFQMTQLFQNLLANSLKFCKKDIPPVIQVCNQTIFKSSKPILVIEIKDNCIGFNNRDAEKVFSNFTRLHSAYEGTGLGLSICKKIVERHNGVISVNSTEGVGTQFRIEMPMEI